MVGIIGRVYKHFKKGDLYLVKDLSTNVVTDKCDVVYQALYDSYTTHNRPIESFFEDVSNHPENETGQKYRFEEFAADKKK